VPMPVVSFTTKDDSPPVYDTSRLVVSMTDANGVVQITAPALTLPPGSRVQIANFGSGVVGSYTAANDGSLTGGMTPTSIMYPTAISTTRSRTASVGSRIISSKNRTCSPRPPIQGSSLVRGYDPWWRVPTFIPRYDWPRSQCRLPSETV
jgi:hypothetical protein